MFDIGASELLLVVILAIIVIGPKELPLALRTAGRWIGKVRRVSSHFRTGLDAMIREAEMEEMDRKWRAQNDEIMAKYPAETEANQEHREASAMEPLPSSAESKGITRADSEVQAKESARGRTVDGDTGDGDAGDGVTGDGDSGRGDSGRGGKEGPAPRARLAETPNPGPSSAKPSGTPPSDSEPPLPFDGPGKGG